MIIHGAHNSDTSDLYKNGKHVSKVIRNGKTIWQSGTYALLHNGAIGKLCKGHIDMVGSSGNVYVRDGSVYAREGADEYRITSTGDWPHGGADGDWPHSGDYICKMVHTEYATGENWHDGVHDGSRAVICDHCPWNVGTSVGVWCVCDSL